MESIRRFEGRVRRFMEDKTALGRWLLCRLLRKDFIECEIAGAFIEGSENGNHNDRRT